MRISKPIWLEVEPKPQLELNLQNPHLIDVPALPVDYTLRVYSPDDESQIISLLNNAGMSFSADLLKVALSLCLPNGCFVIEHNETRTSSSE